MTYSNNFAAFKFTSKCKGTPLTGFISVASTFSSGKLPNLMTSAYLPILPPTAVGLTVGFIFVLEKAVVFGRLDVEPILDASFSFGACLLFIGML